MSTFQARWANFENYIEKLKAADALKKPLRKVNGETNQH
jgi:hypothetical protein